jgi:hypothetical protein
VLAVSSPSANGTYGVGATITIEVFFNEPVFFDPAMSGTPRLKLNTGSYANYTSGAGTAKWTFEYTVAKGDASSDLDYVTTSSLEPNGAGLVDAAGNPANLTLAAPQAAGSLGASNGIVIETTGPTAGMVSNVPSLKAGETATLTITFSEQPTTSPSVVVSPMAAGVVGLLKPTSDPKVFEAVFTPNTGYENVGGGSVLVGLTIAAGSYTDLAGNPGAATSLSGGLLVDTRRPTVGIAFDRPSLAVGQATVVTFTFSEPVSGFSDADVFATNLLLKAGSWKSITQAVYQAEYLPASSFEGTATIDVFANVASDLAGNGNDAALQASLNVDTKSPTVSIVANPVSLTSATTSTVTFTFSSAPKAGTFTDSDVIYDRAKGTLGPITGSSLVYTATFTPNPSYTGDITISIAAGAFTDAVDNPNVTGDSATLTVDTVAPRVLSVSAPRGIYNADDVIPIAVTFTEALAGDLPELNLNLNSAAGGVRSAFWKATDPTDSRIQIFEYKVVSGDNANPLDYLTIGSLTDNDKRVEDSVGNAADLTLPVPGQSGSLAASGVVVDTLPPAIVNVRANRTGVTLKARERIRIDLEFSEALPYTPTRLPEINLVLNTGGLAKQHTMIGDRTIRLIYEVGPGENTDALDYFTVDALMLAPAIRNGQITDFAGNLANLKLPVTNGIGLLRSNNTIKVDTAAPQLLGVTADTPAGSYKSGATITLRARFNEPVAVDANPALQPKLRLALPGERYATFAGVQGTDVLFRYVVVDGDASSRLDYLSTTALTGTIRDLVGNVASPSLPVPGESGSISAGPMIAIDTTAPRVDGVALLSAPGEYGPGSVIHFTVTMSERVNVSNPTVRLNTTPARDARLVNQSIDGRMLTFEYRPTTGDVAQSLNYASTSALAGTLTDAAGNTAVLTLPNPVAGQSLGGPGIVTVDARIKVVTTSPALSATPPGAAITTPLTSIDLVFNVPVTGVNPASFTLFYQGRSISLKGATVTGSGTSYRLTLPRSLTNLNGLYRLRVGGASAGIRAVSDGAVMTAGNFHWQKVAAR